MTMQVDPLLARGLAARYGRADREICQLLKLMAEVPEAAGKKTLFGADKHEVAIKAFIKQLFKTCAALVEMKQLNAASTKAQSLSALNSILASYRLAYAGNDAAFGVWDKFFAYQITVEPDKPWLLGAG